MSFSPIFHHCFACTQREVDEAVSAEPPHLTPHTQT